MRRFFTLLIIIVSSVILLIGISFAGEIDKETWSLGGSLNINNSTSDFDEDNVDSTKSLNVTMSGGYFVVNNFEIELGIDYRKEEVGDLETINYSLIPMINYHLPITESSNLILGIGIRQEKYEYKYKSFSDDGDSFGYGIKVGFELFLITNAALTLEAIYWEIEYNYDDADIDLSENRLIVPQIGIKLYF